MHFIFNTHPNITFSLPSPHLHFYCIPSLFIPTFTSLLSPSMPQKSSELPDPPFHLIIWLTLSPAVFVSPSPPAVVNVCRSWARSYLRAQTLDWKEQTAPWEAAGPARGRACSPERRGSVAGWGWGQERTTKGESSLEMLSGFYKM